MKKTLVIITTLAMLAGTSLMAQTNAPADGAKPPVKPYPLKTCLVSGEKLGEMGKPAVIIYKGQEIKFCCPDCIKDFNKDPDKFLKKMAEEVKNAKK
jgi:YHS domain-containing protein